MFLVSILRLIEEPLLESDRILTLIYLSVLLILSNFLASVLLWRLSRTGE